MKRILSLILIAAISILLLAGCAGKELTDGSYTAEVRLSGGSGRTSVASPAKVIIQQGQATATIVWSSPFYEFMEVDGKRYEPLSNDGTSIFQIPIRFDEEIPVSASTVAMGQPHLIDYTLYFDASSLKDAS